MHETENCRAPRGETRAREYDGGDPGRKVSFRCIELAPNRLACQKLQIYAKHRIYLRDRRFRRSLITERDGILRNIL